MSEGPLGEADGSTTSKSKNVSCADCGQKYASKSGLRYHLQNSECEFSHECPRCDYKTYSERGVKHHYGREHEGSLAGFETKCSGCGKKFRVKDKKRLEFEENFCSESCMRQKKTISCDNCGEDIVRRPSEISESNFCDRECQSEHKSQIRGEDHPLHKEKVSTECGWCGKSLQRYPYRIEEQKQQFCNNQCQGRFLEQFSGKDHSLYNRVRYNCDNCGKTMRRKPSRLENHKWLFCSLKCKNEYDEYRDFLSGQREKEKVGMKCEICNSGFSVIPSRKDRAKVCSRECRIELTRQITGEDHHAWKPNGGKGFGENWSDIAEAIREEYEYECQSCGVEQSNLERRLDVHHIIPRSEFDDISQANEKDNLIPLCRSCHRKWEGIPLKPQ